MSKAILLPDECYETVRQLKCFGVLAEVEPQKIRQHGDIVVDIGCGDCHQRPEWKQYLATMFKYLHSLTLNGGGVAIPVFSKANPGDIKGRAFLMDIPGSFLLKGTHVVLVTGHAPCGLVRHLNISLLEKVGYLVAAKHRIKQEIRPEHPETKVISLFHVNYGHKPERKPQGMKTYIIDDRKWTQWCTEKGDPLVSYKPECSNGHVQDVALA